jgi:hypothetical protein
MVLQAFPAQQPQAKPQEGRPNVKETAMVPMVKTTALNLMENHWLSPPLQGSEEDICTVGGGPRPSSRLQS